MKKLAAIILFFAMAAALAYFAVQHQRLNDRYAETQQEESAVREQFGAALQSIAEIQDSLNVILPAEERLARMSRNVEMGSSVTQTQKEQMLGTIDDLKQSVGDTRQKIESLEKSLAKGKTEMAGLRRIVDNLKKSITEREETIQRLTGEITSLTATVAVLQTDVQRGQETIAEQQRVIEARTKELGTVYYMIATKDRLKKRGIITEKGGFIGFGKTPQLTASFNEEDFTAIDTNVFSEIPLTGANPQVLSAQSKASYDLKRLSERTSKLVIKDPAEFRRVKYVVVMVEEV
jgi:predicted  nucleic acid-binding Zn-ribbon protein